MTDTFSIVPGQTRVAGVLVAVFLVMAAILVTVVYQFKMMPSVAPHSHGSIATYGVPLLVIGILGVVMGAVSRALSGAKNTRFLIDDGGLRIRGDLYGRFIPSTQLQPNAARVVDLQADPSLAPVWKLMGTGVPGYRSGWFKLRNGERALVYLTDLSHVVYLPTTKGYVVLLSVGDPAGFIHRLASLVCVPSLSAG